LPDLAFLSSLKIISKTQPKVNIFIFIIKYLNNANFFTTLRRSRRENNVRLRITNNPSCERSPQLYSGVIENNAPNFP
jgi:hypothetical protein